jgi:hypothetical protein
MGFLTAQQMMLEFLQGRHVTYRSDAIVADVGAGQASEVPNTSGLHGLI